MAELSLISGILFGIGAMLCWGISDFFAAKSARRTSVIKTFFWSQLISLILFSLTFFLFFQLPNLSITYLLLILAMTTLAIVGFLTFYKALKVGKVGIASPIVNAWSLITVLLAILFLGESLTKFQPLALLLVIAGAVLTSFKFKDLTSLNLKKAEVGVGYSLIAFFAFGITFAILGLLVKETNWFIPVYLGKIVQIPMLLGYSGIARQSISFPKSIILPLIIIGILETVGFFSYGLGITYAYTAVVAPIAAAVPIVTVTLAKIFFREKFDISQKIGIISVLVGLVLLSM